MSAVLISGGLRSELFALFAAAFNDELASACKLLGIPEFSFNWLQKRGEPTNCFEGAQSFEDLLAFELPDFPAVTWWTGAGQDLNTEKARRFSGIVSAGWRFFPAVQGRSRAGLAQQRMAIEAAIAATLCAMGAETGHCYRKDLSWSDPLEIRWVDRDQEHVGWAQEVTYSATFEVNV